MRWSPRVERRAKRRLRWTSLCFLVALFLLRNAHDHFDLAIGESAVDFSCLHHDTQHPLRPPSQALRHWNSTHIDDRYLYQRTLKAGHQGSVYLYSDTQSTPAPDLVIVKTISAVSRNPLPTQLRSTFGNITSTWPSELDASLSITAAPSESDSSPFVPVRDYFLLQEQPGDANSWAWTMVSPFISGGDLMHLARELRSIGRTDQIDKDYRETFYAMLEDLQQLHARGFCHDDVKPANVFITAPKRWLLGDLGNTRQVDHAWHATRLWRRRDQLSDCRHNDERRALRSYLSFLRQASHDRWQFDSDFLSSRTGWAQMYWSFIENPTSWSSSFAEKKTWTLLQPLEGPTGPLGWHRVCVFGWLRALVVRQELLFGSLWWKIWFTF